MKKKLKQKLIHAGIGVLMIIAHSTAQADENTCGPSDDAFFQDEESLLFSTEDKDYGDTDLPEALQIALYDAELWLYKEKLRIIDEALLDIHLDQMAIERESTKKLLKDELLAAPAVTDDEIGRFYEANKKQIPYPLDQVSDRIKQMLVDGTVQSKKAELISLAKQQMKFKLSLKSPVAPIVNIATEGLPSKGSKDPKLTLVEFADYQCPHCKTASMTIKKILDSFSDVLQVIYMDYPINPSGISRAVAEGAVCANQQESFWEYHDLAFEQQQNLNSDSPLSIAKDLGLDEPAFKSCLDSKDPTDRVAKSEQEAKRLGVSATPTLFLNGRRLHLHDLENNLEMEIKKALVKAVS